MLLVDNRDAMRVGLWRVEVEAEGGRWGQHMLALARTQVMIRRSGAGSVSAMMKLMLRGSFTYRSRSGWFLQQRHVWMGG